MVNCLPNGSPQGRGTKTLWSFLTVPFPRIVENMGVQMDFCGIFHGAFCRTILPPREGCFPRLSEGI